MSDQSLLSRLLQPDELAAFFSRDWGRRMRHWPGSLTALANLSIDLDAFETSIAGLNRAHEGWLHFADRGLEPVPQDFVRPEGFLDMQKIAAAFAGNKTLYLTKAECVMEPLSRICEALLHDLADHGIAVREKVNAHVFLTPCNSQGFAPHRDAHASFILQCEGRKHWRVYVPRAFEPEAHRTGVVSPDVLAEHDLTEVTLEKGDILYMPEFWPHEAAATAEHSLHVTLRVFPLRYYDLMARIVSNSDTLFAPVPRGTSDEAAEALAAIVASEHFLDQLLRAFPAAWQDIAKLSDTPRQTGLLRRVLEADEIELQTSLVRNQAVACDIRESGDNALLIFAGTFVRGPRLFRRVFEFVAEHVRFRPCDLPEIEAHYDRLKVSRRLVRDGLLSKDA